MMPISTDIGGTFTDFVVFDKGAIRTFKVPSTP
ncbi:MAG: hydantoinase/oxoprolinase N-terminal domain-containing protein [Euryarchaeota archaeon]|nr:hydantoinase/oxoprolinase N-terminal domain-containing protein [Euryarchaeota archaeon]